jgi:hypothetical protein
MGEWRLFPEGTVPEYTKPSWYAGRSRAPHLEQGEHRDRLIEAAAQVHAAAVEFFDHMPTVSDLGAGDGGLLSILDRSRIIAAWGYDLQQTNVDAARDERGVSVSLGDVVEGWLRLEPDGPTHPIRFGDISVCTEMLEHLVDPHWFVKSIVQSRVLVASSPWTENDQNHYEFHTWAFDQAGYRALLEQGGYRVVRQEIRGMFQVLTGVRD